MTKHAGNDPDKTLDPTGSGKTGFGAEDFRTWINHPKSVARLQILVVVLGTFVVLGFFAVIGRIAYLTLYPPGAETPATATAASPQARAARVSVPAANPTEAVPVEIPAGAVVEDIQPMADGSLMVHFKDPRGTGMLLIDPSTGAILKTLRFVPAGN